MKKMSNLKIPFAIGSINDREDWTYSPKEISNWKKTKIEDINNIVFRCPSCGEEVIHHNPQGTKIRPYFAHKINSGSLCIKEPTKSYQSSLHRRAKDIYVKSIVNEKKGTIKIKSVENLFPDYNFVYDKVKVEQKENGFIPDVVLINSDTNEKIAIEIKVSHSINERKESLINREKLVTIEIDLSQYKDDEIDDNFLENLLSKELIVKYKNIRNEQIEHFHKIESANIYWNIKNLEGKISKVQSDISLSNIALDIQKKYSNNDSIETIRNQKVNNLKQNKLLKKNMEEFHYCLLFFESIDSNTKSKSMLYNLKRFKECLSNLPEFNIYINDDLISYLDNLNETIKSIQAKSKTLIDKYQLQKEKLENELTEYINVINEFEKIDKKIKDIQNMINQRNTDIEVCNSFIEKNKNILSSDNQYMLDNRNFIDNYTKDKMKLEDDLRELELVKSKYSNYKIIIKKYKQKIDSLNKSIQEEIKKGKYIQLDNDTINVLNYVKESCKELHNDLLIKLNEIEKNVLDEQNFVKVVSDDVIQSAVFTKTNTELEKHLNNLNEERTKYQNELKYYNERKDNLIYIKDIIDSSKECNNYIIIPNINEFKRDICSESIHDFISRKGENFIFPKGSINDIYINKEFIINWDSLANKRLFIEILFFRKSNKYLFKDFKILLNPYKVFQNLYIDLVDDYNNEFITYLKEQSISYNGINIYIPYNLTDYKLDIERYFKGNTNIDNFNIECLQTIFCIFCLQGYRTKFFDDFENNIKSFTSKEEFLDYINYVKNEFTTLKKKNSY